MDDDDNEAYILLLLSDSNLPTGSFVASSGLESYVKHGFSSPASPTATIVSYIQDSLGAYARSALPFVSDGHRIVGSFKQSCGQGPEADLDKALRDLAALDDLYDTMTLNHVARRASKSQGVALLTLYSKGFSRPSVLGPEGCNHNNSPSKLSNLLEKFKLMVRREETHGHLPICWGALTAALGLSLGPLSSPRTSVR
ncbi:hypothetical protein C0995_014853 [Termitomyces sp. Mi166|nr:hypothetical protein C0995_014853 [Termitomyces sp. Mi166\